jgi:hypothetical protein
LLVCAVLPYSVLRYFQGGVDVGSELTTIGSLLLGSVLLSGVAVGLSPHSSRLMRALLVIAVVIALQAVPRLLFFRMAGSGGVVSGPGAQWQMYAVLAWLGLVVLLVMLEVGASKISPLAENHSTSRRVLGLLVLAVIAVFGRGNVSASILFPLSALVLSGICIGALCELPRFVPSMYRPFVKFGVWGRIAGRVLYPGWPSGVFYCLFVALVMTLIMFRHDAAIDPKWVIWAGVSAAGTLLFPAAIIRTLMPRTRRPFLVYIGIQVILALLVAFAASLKEFNLSDFRMIVAMIPTCGLLLSGSDLLTEGNYNGSLTGMGLVTAASIAFLLQKMRSVWREIRKSEKAAAQLLSRTSVDATDLAASS